MTHAITREFIANTLAPITGAAVERVVAYETPQVAEGHWEVLHNPLKARSSVCFKPLITNGIELAARILIGVCDNQWAFTRKLLILKTERCPSG